jgi:hypothetical protein
MEFNPNFTYISNMNVHPTISLLHSSNMEAWHLKLCVIM